MPILRNTAICFFALLFFSCIKLSNSLNRTLEELTVVQLAPAHRIVIGGNAGTILSSLDGLTWTTGSIGDSTFNITALAYSGRNFVAVGMTSGSSICRIYYSANASAWVQASIPSINCTSSVGLLDVTTGGNTMLAVGTASGTAPIILRSIDHGVTWSAGSCASCGNPVTPVIYDGTYFILSAIDANSNPVTFRSTDGSSFSISGSPFSTNAAKQNRVTRFINISGVGVIAAGSSNGATEFTQSSISLNHSTSWTMDSGIPATGLFQASSAPLSLARGLAYSGTRLVAVGDNCRIAFTNSPASLSWTNPPTITGCTAGTVWRGLIYDGSKFVATGTNAGGQGQIAVSPTGSGTDWTITTPGTGPLTGIALSP